LRYKKLGHTGKSVSVLGFGGMRFSENEDEAIRAVRRAVDLGVNYFDTAPGYCDDRSEAILGAALAGLHDRVLISTKSSIGQDPTEKDVLRRIELSLKRLRSETIHFFHMWCVMDLAQFRRIVAPGGPLAGALRARDEGLIRHIFFSAHANGEEVEEIVASGLFEGVTLGYSIMNFTNRFSGIQAAHRAGLGVVTMNPLGGGLLPKAGERFAFLREGPDDSVARAALRFNLLHPEIDVVLSGMRSVEEVEENVRAVEEVTGPSAERARELKERFEKLSESYCTLCRYCEPCPAGIRMPWLVFAVDRFRLGDKTEAFNFFRHYESLGYFSAARASDCTECGECEKRCTQRLPVVERIRAAARLFEAGR
jgi:predicted aldo/keto reductase-like oxidoreductase